MTTDQFDWFAEAAEIIREHERDRKAMKDWDMDDLLRYELKCEEQDEAAKRRHDRMMQMRDEP